MKSKNDVKVKVEKCLGGLNYSFITLFLTGFNG